MRRVLAPLRRCFADDGRRTRLRALYEDAALVRGSDAAVIGETDPTTVIADRKIADAARRGVFDKLDGQGAPLKAQPHRSAALSAAESDAGELRREIRETKERLRRLREAEAAHARDEAIARTLFDFIGECEAAGVDIAPLKDVAALVADGPAANKTAH